MEKSAFLYTKLIHSWKMFYLNVIFWLETNDQGLCHFVMPLVADVPVVLVVDSVIWRTLENERNKIVSKWKLNWTIRMPLLESMILVE